MFYISLLELGAENPIEGKVIPPPPSVIVDSLKKYEVDHILNSGINQHQLEYLIKSTGYEHPNWIDARDVNELEAVDCFHT